MKKPTMLLRRVLLDVRLQPLDTIELDYEEICSRYENEGMSFLTITLPTLDDVLVKGLASGRLSRSDFPGFRPDRRRGSLPALLQGFFKRVFDRDGLLLDQPDVGAIFAIRQITRLFKKVELDCSEPRKLAAYERYKSNDKTTNWNQHRSALDASIFASVSGYLWSDLEELSGALYCFPGQFGSGATAGRERRNERQSIRKWPERSESSFPVTYHAIHRPDADDIAGIRYLSESEEEPVRVVQVPKTLKTPRTISVEPSYMMLMQQSIAKPLMAYLESKRFGFRSIRFSDQSVNRELARLGSIDGSLATIDLSDASDLVSNNLVVETFGKVCPSFLQLIQDCRSRTAKLPDGSLIRLNKFASQGSAMCFPVEAMIFFTLVLTALVRHSGKVPSRQLLQNLARDVAVYGDDIIVPSKMAPDVMATLQDYGLKVNQNKSFHTGLFRESCGGDYYGGVDVTPTYVRHWDNSGTLRTPSLKLSYASMANNFYVKGLWNTSQFLRDTLDKTVRKRIPISTHQIGCIHYVSFFRTDSLQWNPATHNFRVKGLRAASIKQDDPCGTPSAFLGNSLSSSYYRRRMDEFLDNLDDGPNGESEYRLRRLLVGDFYTSLPQGGHPGADRSIRDLVRRQFLPNNSGTLRLSEERNGLEHLNDVRSVPRSFLVSERPYSLCLKSRWTASPAGLNW